MTEAEIIDLFEEMAGAGLANAPKDPAAAVKVWRDFFGGDDARIIGRAVGLHLDRSKFWPTPSDINSLKVRAQWILEIEDNQRRQALLPPKAPELLINPSSSFCDLCGLCDIRDQSKCPCDN